MKPSTIPYGRQYVDEDDVRAVAAVLRGDFLTTGPQVAAFESSFAKKVGAKHAVAVSSGTAALHLACLAAGLGPGDELITTPLTFVASANCAAYCGATPVLADIKSDGSGLIDSARIKEKLSPATKVVVPVHYGGLPCDLEEIREMCEGKGIIIIEDACHALGATYKSSVIGDCAYSDMCVFSLHPVKHITAGEGGVITTNDDVLHERLLMLRSHGIVRSADDFEHRPHGPWYYEAQELGFNYRLTDFQSALGSSQLKKLDAFVARRRQLAKLYDDMFRGSGGALLDPPSYADRASSYHLYVLRLRDEGSRLPLFDSLHREGVLAQVHYVPIHFHPLYQRRYGYAIGDFPEAEDFYSRIMSIPLYFSLSDADAMRVGKMIKGFLKG